MRRQRRACVADHQRGQRGGERQRRERHDKRRVADLRSRGARAHGVAVRARAAAAAAASRSTASAISGPPQVHKRDGSDTTVIRCASAAIAGWSSAASASEGAPDLVAIEDQDVRAEQRHDLERNLLVGGDVEPRGEIVETGAGEYFVDQRARPDGEAVRPQHHRFQPRPARVDRNPRQTRLHGGDQRLAALRLAERGGEAADLLGARRRASAARRLR